MQSCCKQRMHRSTLARQQTSPQRCYCGGKGRGFMAARPSCLGHLRLPLVACPVALYPATSEADTVINMKSNEVEFWVGAAATVLAGWLFAHWLSKLDK